MIKSTRERTSIVDFRITWTDLICRSELRFTIVPKVHRDSEIASIDEMSDYFNNLLYKETDRSQVCRNFLYQS